MTTKNGIRVDWKILAVVIGLAVQVGAVGAFYGKTTARLDSIDKRLEKIEGQVDGGTNDRYRGENAERDFRLRDERINRLEDRINEIEEDTG